MVSEESLKIVVCRPGCKAETVTIDHTLDALQKIVDGYIEAIYPFDDNVALVCNEEGKMIGLPPCRVIRDDRGRICEVICGTFFIVGYAGEEFVSLTPDQIEHYSELFGPAEIIYARHGIIFADKIK